MKEPSIAIAVLVGIVVLLAANLVWQNMSRATPPVTNFDECALAGFPIMESMPRQCRDGDGNFFVEVLPPVTPTAQIEPTMNEQSAREIASASEACLDAGSVGRFEGYNPNSGTWWFTLSRDRPSCTPACVVYDETKRTEIDWRCTGLQGF